MNTITFCLVANALFIEQDYTDTGIYFSCKQSKVVKYIFFFFQELLADAKKSQHDVKVGISSSVCGM